jgi:hypothetical protein
MSILWKNRLIVFYLIFSLLSVSTVIASSKDVIPPNAGELDPATFTILGFNIGVHSLQDVMDDLGESPIVRKDPNINYSPFLVCYTTNDLSDETSIIFEAGPLGGWKTITAYVVGFKNEIPYKIDKYTKSNRIRKDISTENGISLGMTKEKFICILGTPTYVKDEIIAYHYLRNAKMTEEQKSALQKKHDEIFGSGEEISPYYDISSGIEGFFLNDLLVWFRVYKMEST